MTENERLSPNAKELRSRSDFGPYERKQVISSQVIVQEPYLHDFTNHFSNAVREVLFYVLFTDEKTETCG